MPLENGYLVRINQYEIYSPHVEVDAFRTWIFMPKDCNAAFQLIHQMGVGIVMHKKGKVVIVIDNEDIHWLLRSTSIEYKIRKYYPKEEIIYTDKK